MAKILNGSEVASFIKERQAKAVRGIWGVYRVHPTLAIVTTNKNPVSDVYLRIKSSYAEDIGAATEIVECDESQLVDNVQQLNNRNDIHGIILQLPLKDPNYTEQALAAISDIKDVDGLGEKSPYDPPTPTAILWLLGGYGVEFRGKKIVVVGRGRLVGGPLTAIMQTMDVDVTTVDIDTANRDDIISSADILITATGSAGSIHADMIKQGAVVVDAGTSSEAGVIKGDLADDARLRDDVTVTPVRGGVGPLTVSALFENLITATRNQLS